jgi:hypothetical protein
MLDSTERAPVKHLLSEKNDLQNQPTSANALVTFALCYVALYEFGYIYSTLQSGNDQ